MMVQPKQNMTIQSKGFDLSNEVVLKTNHANMFSLKREHYYNNNFRMKSNIHQLNFKYQPQRPLDPFLWKKKRGITVQLWMVTQEFGKHEFIRQREIQRIWPIGDN